MEQDYRIFADVAAEVTIPEDGITSRTLFQDEHIKVVIFGFAPGQELSEHTAAMPAILHFLQGEATVTLGDEVSELKAGAYVPMNAHLPHGIIARTPVVMMLTMIKCAKASKAEAASTGTPE